VGNLAIGGTGKTPMTEFIVAQLKDEYNVATLSRGYKRKTKGFAIANDQTTALEIGDEPMQFHQKFPDIVVAVGEERIVAIPQILFQRPETAVIVLDDAFQHRSVSAGLNIMLTEYNNLYTRDFLFPMGDLRDIKSSSKRAQIIIVTKCDDNLTKEKSNKIIKEINPNKYQKIYFTSIAYGTPYHLYHNRSIKIDSTLDVLLICGIANPLPIKKYLNKQVHSFDMLRYPDHHIFTIADLNDIKKNFEKIASPNKIILTTEKDAVRLEKFRNELLDYPIYVIPIKHQFLFDSASDFVNQLKSYINSYNQ
jgi:tetraacyldisaccharide 4'-kinase